MKSQQKNSDYLKKKKCHDILGCMDEAFKCLHFVSGSHHSSALDCLLFTQPPLTDQPP